MLFIYIYIYKNIKVPQIGTSNLYLSSTMGWGPSTRQHLPQSNESMSASKSLRFFTTHMQ